MPSVTVNKIHIRPFHILFFRVHVYVSGIHPIYSELTFLFAFIIIILFFIFSLHLSIALFYCFCYEVSFSRPFYEILRFICALLHIRFDILRIMFRRVCVCVFLCMFVCCIINTLYPWLLKQTMKNNKIETQKVLSNIYYFSLFCVIVFMIRGI